MGTGGGREAVTAPFTLALTAWLPGKKHLNFLFPSITSVPAWPVSLPATETEQRSGQLIKIAKELLISGVRL